MDEKHSEAGEQFEVRLLAPQDNIEQFYVLLNHLSKSKRVDPEVFRAIIAYRTKRNHFTFIAIDTHAKLIVSTASLLIENKFIHEGRNAGYVEDVVTLPDYRKKGLVRKLNDEIVKLAKTFKCYKIVLDCDIPEFYEKLGYYKNGTAMRMDLD